jgi:hypothetical protein
MTSATLKFIRQIHLYIGVFTAPALLFFAFTGALQTLSLHEPTSGSSYKPSSWIVTLAQVHKHQTAKTAVKKSLPPAPSAKPTSDAAQLPTASHAAPPLSSVPIAAWKSHLPLKLFFLLVTLGLFTSTLTGITMAYKYTRNKLPVTGLLLAGIVIPPLLLAF